MPAHLFTPQLVLGLAVLLAVTVLGVFGVLTEQTAGGIIVGVLGGFGLGAGHQANGAAGGP